MPKFIKFWLPVLLCMWVIFYASSIPGSNIPPLFPFQDIIYHFSIYLILAILFSRAFRSYSVDIKPVRLIIFTVIFGIIYGITDEWHQSFVPNRSVSGFDVFIDGMGVFIGSLVYQWRK